MQYTAISVHILLNDAYKQHIRYSSVFRNYWNERVMYISPMLYMIKSKVLISSPMCIYVNLFISDAGPIHTKISGVLCYSRYTYI